MPTNNSELIRIRTPQAMIGGLYRLGVVDFALPKFKCPKRKYPALNSCGCHRGSKINIRDEVYHRLDMANEKARGLCLGCVKDLSKPMTAKIDSESLTCENPKHAAWDEG